MLSIRFAVEWTVSICIAMELLGERFRYVLLHRKALFTPTSNFEMLSLDHVPQYRFPIYAYRAVTKPRCIKWLRKGLVDSPDFK